MRRSVIVLALLVLALASCTGLSRPDPAPGRDDGFRRLLLADVVGKPPGSIRVRPVDPATLADVPGVAPLDFGHHYTSAISPDNRTLAAFVWPSGSSNSGGTLHVIDLVQWADRLPGIVVDDYVGGLTFDSAGRSLFWTVPTAHDPAHDIPVSFVLQRYDLGSRSPSIVVRLPSSFQPWWQGVRPLTDGRHLAIYGVPTSANNLSEDAPHVLIVDLSERQIVANLRLSGVKAGQFREDDPGGQPSYRIFWPGLAWDLARNRLYVVDADDDWITAVDLAARRILERTEMRQSMSIVDRIGRWLAPSAEAKAVPMTTRAAELSGDGKRLYVSGLNGDVRTNTREIQVVDTGDLSVIRRLDIPATDVALSPDGRRLTLHLWWPANRGEPVRQQAYTVSTAGTTESGRTEDVASLRLLGVSPSRRYAYVSEQVLTGQAIATRLRVVDLRASRIVAERTVAGGFVDLFPFRRGEDGN